MMIEILLLTVQLQQTPNLEQLYWDCDTAYMQQRLEPKDIMQCLYISEAFVEKEFKGDMRLYKEYWEKNKMKEWRRRGYNPV